MHYSYEDVETFIQEENVKFIRLAFFDVFGVQKHLDLPQKLKRASAGILTLAPSPASAIPQRTTCS
ncbi:MAG: hypothetical protein ACLVJX_09740 [Merdibacter sp.]